MAAITQSLVWLVFLIAIAESRILTLHSSDDHLVSDGVDRLINNYNNNNNGPVIPNACDHQYGFLPCAENAAGFIFQILVYQSLLIFGEKQIGRGSKVLFNIIGAGKFGGIIFRILMALPSMMLMIVSGVFSSKENAQSQVSLGVGIYAGITVFSLTVHWGICVIFGRRDLMNKSKENSDQAASTSNCLAAKEKLIILKDTGVEIDQQTRYTAGIMLLSLIPYIIVQLDDFLYTSKSVVTLIALIVSALSLIAYFVYQILNPWIQQRSLDYSKYEMLRTGFLQHVQRQGQLVKEDGKLNADLIKKLFEETDKDADRRIAKGELENLVLDIIKTDKVKVDQTFAVSQVMETFDFDDDRCITEEEFIKGCKKWIDETKQSPENSESASANVFHELFQLFKEKKHDDPQEMDKIMSKILKHAETQLLKSESLITDDGKPNIERIQDLFKQFDSDEDKSISKSELEQLISTVKFGEFQPKYEDVIKELFKDFDKDNNNIIEEPEFIEGVSKWLNKAVRVANAPDKKTSVDEFDKIVWKQAVYNKWALFVSLFQVLLGIVIMTFLGGPLMVSILQLSYAMSFPSFSISFVIVPLAMNARAVLAAIFPASQKSKRTASLTFSEIYGGVIMNNIAGLTTLLAIVYAKDLTWDFSAEVLTILVVCAIVGTLAYTSTTYPLWTCIVAFLLYPFSLGLFYFVQVWWSWN
ncbi:hypothetical protein PHJA_002678700 [Phtheirospermum japonicum]|uniref:EF-hand domain-containing protein n=1 Tax=Phtheirospermum japonicum TaxID=374723 RepID=A0A830DEN3_9LAMI|nr:hypothetical protein PHJA_002678700 [Phtheirospermum japonicum]